MSAAQLAWWHDAALAAADRGTPQPPAGRGITIQPECAPCASDRRRVTALLGAGRTASAGAPMSRLAASNMRPMPAALGDWGEDHPPIKPPLSISAVKAQAIFIKNRINSIHAQQCLSHWQVYRTFSRVLSGLRSMYPSPLNMYTCSICFIIKCYRPDMLCVSTHDGRWPRVPLASAQRAHPSAALYPRAAQEPGGTHGPGGESAPRRPSYGQGQVFAAHGRGGAGMVRMAEGWKERRGGRGHGRAAGLTAAGAPG